MSLTSYRAAPPRGEGGRVGGEGEGGGSGAGGWGRSADLAATYSPAPWGAVPWARRGFTAEFGMGSGGAPALSATRSADRPRPPARTSGGRGPVVPASVSVGWLASSLGVVGMGARRGRGAVAAGGVEVARAIRTGKLRASPRFHPRPIDVVVSHGPRARPGLEEGFPLRCLQRLSRPGLATRLRGWRHDRSTRGPSAPVLSYWGRPLASLERPRQIGTELSHDVLNPAHVPL